MAEDSHAAESALPRSRRVTAPRPVRFPRMPDRRPPRRRAGLSGVGRATRYGDADPRTDATGHRLAGREGDCARPAPFLASLCSRTLVRHTGEIGLAVQATP